MIYVKKEFIFALIFAIVFLIFLLFCGWLGVKLADFYVEWSLNNQPNSIHISIVIDIILIFVIIKFYLIKKKSNKKELK